MADEKVKECQENKLGSSIQSATNTGGDVIAAESFSVAVGAMADEEVKECQKDKPDSSIQSATSTGGAGRAR
jgi:hypothetical protein